MRPNPKFSLGQVVATPGAFDIIKRLNINPFVLLSRHIMGDWGDVEDEDQEENEEALIEGFRLYSCYEIQNTQIWIITDAADDQGNRSTTTILLPEEY